MPRKITIHCHDKAGNWTEEYVEGEHGSFPQGHATPKQWARDMIAHFNATLRPGDAERVLDYVDVETFDGVQKIPHDWEKTNLVTISDRNGIYDTAKCRACGITSKRFGVGEHTRDKAFAGAEYETCNGAKAALAAKGKKKKR